MDGFYKFRAVTPSHTTYASTYNGSSPYISVLGGASVFQATAVGLAGNEVYNKMRMLFDMYQEYRLARVTVVYLPDYDQTPRMYYGTATLNPMRSYFMYYKDTNDAIPVRNLVPGSASYPIDVSEFSQFAALIGPDDIAKYPSDKPHQFVIDNPSVIESKFIGPGYDSQVFFDDAGNQWVPTKNGNISQSTVTFNDTVQWLGMKSAFFHGVVSEGVPNDVIIMPMGMRLYYYDWEFRKLDTRKTLASSGFLRIAEEAYDADLKALASRGLPLVDVPNPDVFTSAPQNILNTLRSLRATEDEEKKEDDKIEIL